MRLMVVSVVVALVAVGAPKPTENIAWGPAENGIRIGLAFGDAAPDPQLRVIFQNVSKQEYLIPVGSESAKGPVYDVQFLVVSPKGEEAPIFNFNGPAGIQPAAKPLVLDIPRGQSHEIVLSMKKLMYLDKGANRPLSDLLAQHYSVHATVDTSGEARWNRVLNQWMGKLVSGELKMP